MPRRYFALGANVFDVFAAIWQRLTNEIAQLSPLDLLIRGSAAIVLLTLIYLGRRFWRRLVAWANGAFSSRWDCRRKIARARDAVDDQGLGLWLTAKQHRPKTVDNLQNLGKLILTVANLKGGVGKTTLTANLAAFFATSMIEADPRVEFLSLTSTFKAPVPRCSLPTLNGNPARSNYLRRVNSSAV